jgi:tRNA-uridine 2-sulfurtransferase
LSNKVLIPGARPFRKPGRLGVIIVGLSGGVDSSVAAYLLKRQGWEVFGATAVLWPGSLCCGDESIAEAKRTAKILDIPHQLINVIPQFGAQVIQPFVDYYYQGKTPNPCTVCNRTIKFGEFFAKAKQELNLKGSVFFGTGHYAGIQESRERFLIRKGRDSRKDQSYMLYALTQEQLVRTVFPLAKLTKTQVRKIAARAGLDAQERPESQDACFVGGDYKKFIQEFSGVQPRPGQFLHVSGKVLGEHQGIPFYTIGQRRGLGVAFNEPLYVVAIDVRKNEVILGAKKDLLDDCFTVQEINWLAEPPQRKFVAQIKVRYNSPAIRGIIDPLSGLIKLSKKIEAITPGQAAVFYRGSTVVGGGIIAKEEVYGRK